MKCTRPIYAINNGFDLDTGKNHIVLAKKRADSYNYASLHKKYGENLIALSCGQCLACKINYAREWSTRCMLEASLYKENWFLTLTYSDDNVPSNLDAVKDDVRSFIKRLRNEIPGLRFFCCGERGERTKRPHAHMILFNAPIPDLKYVSKGRLGGSYFDSKLIFDKWQKGQITIGEVTPNSCEYVARYCLKKVNGDEFLTMSLKPGIGGQYALDHFETIYDTDGVYVRGRKMPVPRYFDKLLERYNLPLFTITKLARRDFNYQTIRRNSMLSSTGFNFDEELLMATSQANLDKAKDKLKKGVL